MDIASIKPGEFSLPSAPAASGEETAQRRQLAQAARSVNSSGLLGRNQLVFTVDRATHRPIIRVEDSETHEILLQLPPEYVLRLAQELGAGSAHITSPSADT